MQIDTTNTLNEKIQLALRNKNKVKTGGGLDYMENLYHPYNDGKRKGDPNTKVFSWEGYNQDPDVSHKAKRLNIYKSATVHPNSMYMIEKEISFMNQGNVGGCSLMSVLNLLQLGGYKDETDAVLKTFGSSYSALRSEKKFETLYKNKLHADNEGYNNYRTFSEFLNEHPRLNDLSKYLGYQWVRSRALMRTDRRGPYNSIIGGRTLTSTRQYNEKTLEYLRDMIDNGYAIGIAWQNHFVAYVGYYTDGFIALGSYGDDADQGGLHRVPETILFTDSISDFIFIKVADPAAAITNPMAGVAVGSGKTKKVAKKTKKVTKKKAAKKTKKKAAKKPKKKAPEKKSEPSVMLTNVERIEARKKKGLARLLGQPVFW